eukprot:7228535-Lingulodinium_polyedra.AAC.1
MALFNCCGFLGESTCKPTGPNTKGGLGEEHPVAQKVDNQTGRRSSAKTPLQQRWTPTAYKLWACN